MHLKAMPSTHYLEKVLNISSSTPRNLKSKTHACLSLKNSAISILELCLKYYEEERKKDEDITTKIFQLGHNEE